MQSPFVKAVNEDTFQEDVLSQSQLSLVDFWAEWCGPCKALAPTVASVAEKYQKELNVVSVDVDNNQPLAQKYGVRGIPTLLLIKDGECIGCCL